MASRVATETRPMFLRSETPFLILRQDPCRYSSTVRHNPKKFSCEWSLILYPFKIRVKAQSRLEGHSRLFDQASHSELAQGCIRKATTEPSFQSKGGESRFYYCMISQCFPVLFLFRPTVNQSRYPRQIRGSVNCFTPQYSIDNCSEDSPPLCSRMRSLNAGGLESLFFEGILTFTIFAKS